MNKLFVLAVLIVLIFILAGIDKIKDFMDVVRGLQEKVKLDAPLYLYQLAVVFVLCLEIIGSGIILYSAFTGEYKNYAYYACLGLALFTIVATIIYHFPSTKSDYYHSMSHISIVGGLLLLANSFKEDGTLSLQY